MLDKNVIGALIVLVLAVAAIAYVVVPAGEAGIPFFPAAFVGQCVGFTGLSLGQIDYISTDPRLGGSWWTALVSQDCRGGKLYGEITQTTDEGQTMSGFNVTMSLDYQKCKYNFQQNIGPISRYSYSGRIANWDGGDETHWCSWYGVGEGEYAEACFAAGGVAYNRHDWYFPDKCFTCIKKDSVGVAGEISTPWIAFRSQISIDAKGVTVSGYLDSEKADVVRIGADPYLAYAYWVGNLGSGASCPDADTKRALGLYKDGRWKIVNENYYEDYRSKTTLIEGEIDITTANFDILKLRIDAQQRIADTFAASTVMLSSGQQLLESSSLTSGQVQTDVDMSQLLNYPLIKLKIKADWLAFVEPCGIPRITSTEATTFETGQTAGVTITVKNLADQLGAFSTTLSCPAGVSQTGILPHMQVGAGATGTVSIPVTAVCDATKTVRCTATVQDRNCPNNIDTMGVDVTCTPIAYCTPNQQYCEGDYLKTCNAAGSGADPSKTRLCEHGCVGTAGAAECRGVPPPPNGCGTVGVCEAGEADWKLLGMTIFAGTCPSDCEKEGVDIIFMLMIVIMIGITIGYGQRGQVKNQPLNITPYIIGLVLGMVAILVLQWLLQNWIFVVLGGIGILLVGGMALVAFLLGILPALMGGRGIQQEYATYKQQRPKSPPIVGIARGIRGKPRRKAKRKPKKKYFGDIGYKRRK